MHLENAAQHSSYIERFVEHWISICFLLIVKFCSNKRNVFMAEVFSRASKWRWMETLKWNMALVRIWRIYFRHLNERNQGYCVLENWITEYFGKHGSVRISWIRLWRMVKLRNKGKGERIVSLFILSCWMCKSMYTMCHVYFTLKYFDILSNLSVIKLPEVISNE